MKYSIVLFKNKEKKKVFKRYMTIENAKQYYKKLMEESKKVIFPKEIEGSNTCKYELAIIEHKSRKKAPVYVRDELGKQIKVELDDKSSYVIKIEPYFIEEIFWDKVNNKKITIHDFINNYLKGKGLKMISKLNNKIIVQNDEKVNLFTFKFISEADRFIDILFNYLVSKNKKDCILVKDYNTVQRSELYDVLEKMGFPRSYLFRHSTRHSRLNPSKK